MTKLCPRGKAAAKRKFAVYPSAYANAYASKICAGKIKDPSGVKRKDFKGPKPAGKAMGGRIGFKYGTPEKRFKNVQEMKDKFRSEKFRSAKNKGVDPKTTKAYQNLRGGGVAEAARKLRAQGLMGGGMAMPRAMYGKGGGVCKRGMNRQAIGKNS